MTFATLEDEHGLINVTIWKSVAERNLVALDIGQLLIAANQFVTLLRRP